jgi:hypothetical protein
VCTLHALCFLRRNSTFEYFAHVIVNILLVVIPMLVIPLCILRLRYVRWWVLLRANHSLFGFMIMFVMDASTSRWIFPWENRRNLQVFNLWPVIYHAKKNSCAKRTPETLSVEKYMSQRNYPKSTHFYFVAIDVS